MDFLPYALRSMVGRQSYSYTGVSTWIGHALIMLIYHLPACGGGVSHFCMWLLLYEVLLGAIFDK